MCPIIDIIPHFRTIMCQRIINIIEIFVSCKFYYFVKLWIINCKSNLCLFMNTFMCRLKQIMESGFYVHKQIMLNFIIKQLVKYNRKRSSTPRFSLDYLLPQTHKPIKLSEMFKNVFILLLLCYCISLICFVIEGYLQHYYYA